MCMPVTTDTPAATGDVQTKVLAELTLEDLLTELRYRGWTLYRWGNVEEPALLAAQFDWGGVLDMILLRQNQTGCSYRCPAAVPDRFRPDQVVFWWAGRAPWAMRVILTLPEPNDPGAPARLIEPGPLCAAPEGLPSPLTMRPLSRTNLANTHPRR